MLNLFDNLLTKVDDVLVAKYLVTDFSGVAIGQRDLLAANGNLFCNHILLGLVLEKTARAAG
jgi:hypothetical protein